MVSSAFSISSIATNMLVLSPISNFGVWNSFILVPANGHGRLLLLFLVQEPHECVTLLCGGGSLFLGLVVLCWVWGLGFGVWGGG